MNSPLDGRTAFVTGAAINIGQATASHLAAAGAAVVCFDVDGPGAAETASGIRSANGRAISVAGDVRDTAAIAAALDAAEAAFGVVDILVNNAGILVRKSFFETTPADWQRVFDVCLTSQFIAAQAVARRLIDAGRPGVIINMCSAAGQRATPEAFAYSVAKSAVLNLTRTMARELGQHRIRVCSVSPTRTGEPTRSGDPAEAPRVQNPDPGTIPLGRIGQPLDIAHAIQFLVSDDAAFITGADFRVDGGDLA